jgi:hypothetical protein
MMYGLRIFLLLAIVGAIFFIFKVVLPGIFSLLKTAHVRKDEDLWRMYVAANEAYLAHRNELKGSPSYRNAVAALSFAALEKCIHDNQIPREKFTDIASHVLEPTFAKARDRQAVINHYLQGDPSSDFHQAVARAEEYLQGKAGIEGFPRELASNNIRIPGV